MRRLLMLVLSMVLLSCSAFGAVNAEASSAQQTLRIGVAALPDSLDPALAYDVDSSAIANGLFEGLVRLNEKGEVIPAMAKFWKISADGRTYTFTLRSSAKWSNKQPVSAWDFEYAWKRALAPDSANAYAFKLFMIANAQKYNQGALKDASNVGVRALNSYTLQVTLKEKTSYFLRLLAEDVYKPVNAKIAKANPYWSLAASTVVTNGPFKLKKWDDNRISAVRNPDYYASKEIRLAEVTFVQPATGSLENAYSNKQIDLAAGNVDPSTLSSADAHDWQSVPIASTYFYQFNTTQPPFNNAKIRKALAMAVERDTIRYGNPGFGFVSWGIQGDGEFYRSQFADSTYFQEDAAQARELLKEGLKEEGLTELPEFSIIINDLASHAEIAEDVIASWEKNLGITATYESQSFGELLENRKHLDYSIARAGWGADYNDPSSFLEYFASWSPDNDSGWSDPTYDGYLKQARQTSDPTIQMHLYAQAEKLLMDQMVILPLYYYVSNLLMRSDVANVNLNYDGSISYTRGYRT
ncbi:peptide ABC transporter substrate-binding protein [Cohnella sp. AR92]|uniref:peptide ABC transporter substrate-binding protein n=1 Tax=Cohnella sp. AR92 TaxID=648716 RepID=UPI0013151B83|nr:peptide ABC transporter substrate-binding protein [Cohnella sp. AR92]